MPLSYPLIRRVEVDGQTRWQATCSTCGQDVCREPQLVKAAVEEARRAHGPEKTCTRSGQAPCRVIGCTNRTSHHHHASAGIVTIDPCTINHAGGHQVVRDDR